MTAFHYSIGHTAGTAPILVDDCYTLQGMACVRSGQAAPGPWFLTGVSAEAGQGGRPPHPYAAHRLRARRRELGPDRTAPRRAPRHPAQDITPSLELYPGSVNAGSICTARPAGDPTDQRKISAFSERGDDAYSSLSHAIVEETDRRFWNAIRGLIRVDLNDLNDQVTCPRLSTARFHPVSHVSYKTG